MRAKVRLSNAVGNIALAQANLDQTSLAAFSELEAQSSSLAQALVCCMGDRQRAARWMTVHRLVFDGRSAYEMAADGDIEPIWDRLATLDEVYRTDRNGLPSEGMAGDGLFV
jgi:hypothetical protein